MKVSITTILKASREDLITTLNKLDRFYTNKISCRSRVALVLLIFFQFSPSASSETIQTAAVPTASNLESNVTLNQLIDYALQSNTKIVEAREAWKATIENRRIATGLPDPQLMFTYFPNPIETRLGPQDWNASLSQAIPYPGKLMKAGDVVDKDSEVARLSLDKSIRDVATNVKIAFYELSYIRSAKKVAAENIKLIEHLRKVGETVYAEDQAALIDIIKAQSQVGVFGIVTSMLSA